MECFFDLRTYILSNRNSWFELCFEDVLREGQFPGTNGYSSVSNIGKFRPDFRKYCSWPPLPSLWVMWFQYFWNSSLIHFQITNSLPIYVYHVYPRYLILEILEKLYFLAYHIYLSPQKSALQNWAHLKWEMGKLTFFFLSSWDKKHGGIEAERSYCKASAMLFPLPERQKMEFTLQGQGYGV